MEPRTSTPFVTASCAPRREIAWLARAIGSVLGGYAFSAGLVTLGSVALPLVTGLPRGEAVLLASMLGFAVYLVALIWAFAEHKLWRVWAGLTAGAAITFSLAYLLKPLLIS